MNFQSSYELLKTEAAVYQFRCIRFTYSLGFCKNQPKSNCPSRFHIQKIIAEKAVEYLTNKLKCKN